ncbi:MAG TPA: AAA family ATPase [Methylomirabilota bacterium]|nr:AAA family ATPase [Methylomirabilota bacterium]
MDGEEALRKFTINLTTRAKMNQIDPGVGKTAIVEGLALKIIERVVPTPLCDKELIAFDFSQLLAGAKFRVEFEERLKAVIKAVEDSNGKYVMFIDKLHTLVGAGAAEGSTDAANMLKPPLARGSLRMIGATRVPSLS